MRKRTALIARLNRIEQQRQPKTPLGRRIIFTICSLPDDKIASFNDNNDRHCIRQAGELLQPFIDRAFAVTGAHAIYAAYASEAAPERDCEAEWANGASQA